MKISSRYPTVVTSFKALDVLFCVLMYFHISGGLKLRVESGLTLMKEDTTLYHLFKCFKDRVSAAAGKRYQMLRTYNGC